MSVRLEPPEPADADFAAVLQLQSQRDPSLVMSAADLWSAPGTVVARFGDEAETALLLSLRRGSRLWPPLGACSTMPADAPDELVAVPGR